MQSLENGCDNSDLYIVLCAQYIEQEPQLNQEAEQSLVESKKHTDSGGKQLADTEIEFSDEVLQFLGENKPENTLKSSDQAMKLLAEFSVEHVHKDSKLSHLVPYCTLKPECNIPGEKYLERIFLQLLLNGRAAAMGLNHTCLVRLRYFASSLSCGTARNG